MSKRCSECSNPREPHEHETMPSRRHFRFPWQTRRELEAELEAELQFHLDEMAAGLRAAGWSAADARAEAVRRFGDLAATRQYCRIEDTRRERGARRMTMLDEFTQDVRYALRALWRSPGFAAVAIITLALGIGVNTAVFSVVRSVLLEPLPFRDPDRLIRLWHANPATGLAKQAVSEPDFLEWRGQSRAVAAMAGYWFSDGLSGVDLTGSPQPERLSVALVTDGFFETLGAPAARGRVFGAGDHVSGRNRMVVLSHGFWTRRFGGDPTLVGRTLTLNGEAFEVVGVMPPGFTYPSDRALDAWIPLSFFGPDSIGRARSARFLNVVARLAPGAEEPQVRAELSSIATALAQIHPENAGWTEVSTLPLRESMVGEVRRPLLVLMAAVGLVLVMACVNIAGLLLARATGRQQELAVRAAVGAGPGRIARQLVTESVTLAVLGGALGIGLGLLAVRALRPAIIQYLPGASRVDVDGVVLGVTVLVSLGTALVFGGLPAIRASGDLESSIRSGGRGTAGAAGQGLRSALVVAEVALAVVLVVGAGLTTKSLNRLVAVHPGFDPRQALVVDLSVSSPDGDLGAAYYRVLDAVRGVPGVVHAGAIRDLPLRGNGETLSQGITTATGGEVPTMQRHHVSTDFFAALGVPVRAGRTFSMTDDAEAPRVLVVNETLARRVWPGQDAVGQVLRFGQAEITVIGVVGDVRQRGLVEPVDAAMYLHVLQQPRSRMSIVARTDRTPEDLAGAVRQAIWAQNPSQTITDVASLASITDVATARPRMLASLLVLFGSVGLTLGVVGIYGVLSYAVTQRRREIGVRVALGASHGDVLGAVLRQGAWLATLGVVVGSVVALMAGRVLGGVLFGIRPTDPVTFLQVAVVMLAAALMASWVPARRALAIQPVTALRND
jgi:predicted permease